MSKFIHGAKRKPLSESLVRLEEDSTKELERLKNNLKKSLSEISSKQDDPKTEKLLDSIKVKLDKMIGSVIKEQDRIEK